MNNARILTFASLTLFALPAVAINPYALEDDSWISINGEVTSVTADAFELDYGDGQITVEMDDGDRDADGYKLIQGDEVRVSGMIDDDFYDLTTIEASSVYVKNIDTYFYASAMDEEDIGYSIISPSVTDTVVQGTITSVDANGEQFTLDSGLQELTVEVDELTYNPLDNEGFQQLDVGDRVSVQGSIDHDFFEGRVFEANYVTTLYSAS
ncbi:MULTISPECIES: DUF5666 domain-containing protein [unclassified Methylophaga]|jgi:uncharacterized protein YdeI (BOF family)|uniref:DUF5666 domain-containing protein n=1 Tax=unclassified Methylophaga TaxID=2629249 RepID=UPI000C58F907|nr:MULTISPECIES: DUF5666 domain-containing protein [unclassified Methylophaga]MAL50802.1 hypothetical protein [Methylophaga sp.]MAP26957.1 hypothetical protein [Methylophaga sp.]MBP23778.1 hypothetical protein [Methylophaga sp.]HAD30119.1 hypothetical protein [Methylophaga sp.]HCC80686.1 hypothetical protein [Methylophaga sp.]|tara:strand:- start:396 stop:1025 length:630 start_codon:yes stop_codon:yes gene_type:complete